MKNKLLLIVFNLMLALGAAQVASAQTTFTYQGKLVDDCCPATGLYDLRLRLWGSVSGGPSVSGSPTLTLPAVPVTNGLFTASLDFGVTAFDGSRRWLEIDVRTNNTGSYVTLAPRTELTPTPYAIRASSAATVPDNAITAPKIATGQVVKSLNGLRDAVNLVAGANVTLTPSGNSLQISAPAVGLSLPYVNNVSSSSPLFTLNNTGSGAAMKLTANATAGFPNAVLHVDGGNASTGIYSYDVTGSAIVGDSWTGSAVVGYSGNGGVGIYGVSLLNKGVYGVGDYGVWGQSDNAGGRGVLGKATGSGNAVGVYGQNDVSGNFGQLGTASFGVYGYGGTGWALLAEGDNGSPFPNLRPKAYLAGGSAVGNRAARFEGVVELSGRLGIGTTSPGFALDVVGRSRLRDGGGLTAGHWLNTAHDFGAGGTADIAFIGTMDSTRVGFYGNDPRGALGWGFTYDTVTGNVGIGTAGAYPTDKLHVNGSARVASLTITGGADIVERFPMSEQGIPKGAVVALDPENPGQLKMSQGAYDKRVAGIVSGANGVNHGLALSQAGVLDEGEPVALTGRVYVLADAANGAIEPGDLLTSSDVPGHAMKATDPARSFGAIIGKAITPLNEGTGFVQVLVSLQ